MFDLQQSKAKAIKLSQQLVEEAKKQGANLCDATCGIGADISTRAREAKIEDITQSNCAAAAIRVIIDGKLGFATSADVPKSADEIKNLVTKAIELANVSTPSEYNIIPQSTSLNQSEIDNLVKKINSFDTEASQLNGNWTKDQALLMDKIARQTKGIDTVDNVEASLSRGVFALSNCYGFSQGYGGTSASLCCGAIALDSDNKKQTDYYWDSKIFVNDLMPAEVIAQKATKQVLSKLGAKKIDSTKTCVIFTPQMSRGFFAAIISAMDGDNIAQKTSFLMNKKNESVLTKGIRVHENPFLTKGLASRPFDGEGQQVKEIDLIDNQGILKTWIHDSRSAARMNEPLTGHASRGASSLPHASVSNVSILGGQNNLKHVIKNTKKGLLVTELMGHSPDIITGDYSKGASGFWIEDGQIAYPVTEITIASNMLTMMKNIDFVGDDLDERSSLRAPTIRFAEMTVSGK